MYIKDVKDFLKLVRSEQTDLELMVIKLNNVSFLKGIAYKDEKIIVGENPLDLSEFVIQNDRMTSTLSTKIEQFKLHQNVAYDMIFGLDAISQRQIMMMYYLTRKQQPEGELTRPYSLDEVAEELNLSRDYVRHAHGNALNILRKKYNNKAIKKG